MQREIKCRGLLVSGEWVYGSLLKWNGYAQIIKHRLMLNNNWQIDRLYVITSTVGEFTGLKDINDAEIYEGDIISNSAATFVVVFNKGCFCFRLITGEQKETELALRALVGGAVIGNIHENPYLLE